MTAQNTQQNSWLVDTPAKGDRPRRLRALRDLAREVRDAPTLEACLERITFALAESELDLPFALCYLLEGAERARLVACAGLAPGAPANPEQLDCNASGSWPIAEALAAECALAIENVQEHFPGLIGAPYAEPIDRAWLLPIRPGLQRTAAVVIVGVSARAAADEAHRLFIEVLASNLSGLAAEVLVREDERRRAATAAALDQAKLELEAFSYSVSHDLRAPLRAIDGFSKALLTDYSSKLDEQGRRYLDRVRSAAQRMAELIDDLLSLSRITRAPLKRERVDLSALSRKILGDLAARDSERKVETCVMDGLTVEGDTRLVTVVLENLLGNAWKFTSKQPAARIEVGSETQDGRNVFFIRDNGAGFDMEYVKKLFTPFQRLHSANDFQGTGIGLATVHRVITRHGGKVWAQGAPDRGASFYFTWGGSS